MIGRFENSTIPGRNRSNERNKQEIKRIVPGSNNQDYPIRLRVNKTRREKVSKRSFHPPRLCPGPKGFQMVA
jgi:hypothetical protein